MKQTPFSPTIYEINTPIFLYEIGRREGRIVTLADVPDAEWDAIARPGINTVWFMGVWKRSATARQMALNEPWLKDSLPDLRDEDTIGSAYSIQEYAVDERWGGNEGLAVARQKLRERGIGLILDFVPNHVAIDHGWTETQPEYFLSGSSEELATQPGAFADIAGGIYAKGKDPNFEPWSDVLQLNAFSSELRTEVERTLRDIASMSDGVRCDMAMLMMNTIFKQTWGDRAGEMPSSEYWPQIIESVRSTYPEFLFIAEVYWGKEQDLLDQGFDFCYDKELYDAFLEADAVSVRTYLQKPASYQQHLLRFIENHDEERAAKEFTFDQHTAVAAAMALLPGGHLYHDGQREGRRVRVPVHLARRTDETPDDMLSDFYDQLFTFVSNTNFYDNEWRLVSVTTGLFHKKSEHIIAWEWENDDRILRVVMNYGLEKASGKVTTNNRNSRCVYTNSKVLSENIEQKSSSVLHLDPWQVSVYEIKK